MTLYKRETVAHYAGHGNQYFTEEYTPVDAKIVNRGKWKPVAVDTRGRTNLFDCNVCGRRVFLRDYICACEYDYCPNCGAVMEETLHD